MKQEAIVAHVAEQWGEQAAERKQKAKQEVRTRLGGKPTKYKNNRPISLMSPIMLFTHTP